jgi:ketosteroid isomerase-like protein
MRASTGKDHTLSYRTAGQDGAGDDLAAASGRLAEALRNGDREMLDGLTDPDFAWIDETGRVGSRRDAMPEAASGEASRSMRDYGSVAMVLGAARPVGGGETVTLDVWVKTPEGWRALVHHRNALADPDAPPAQPAPVPRPPDAPPAECRNPCEFVPYEAKGGSERDIVAAFQALEKAVTRNDADEWVRHMADGFVVYRTNQRPTTKAQRAGHLRAQKSVNAETFVAAVEAMRLWVHGDAAVMRADHAMPGGRRPPYRATRVWVKRDGRWQMAVSQQTTRAA